MAKRRGMSRRGGRGVWFNVGSGVTEDFNSAPLNPFGPAGPPVPPPATGVVLQWSDANPAVSVVGPNPTFIGSTPSTGNVTGTSGMSFALSVPSPGTFVVKFKATKKSSLISGNVPLIGPLSVSSTGLHVGSASFSTQWESGDTVVAVVQYDGAGKVRVGRVK